MKKIISFAIIVLILAGFQQDAHALKGFGYKKTAHELYTDTSGFNGKLSSSNTTVQSALNTLDDMTTGDASTDTSTSVDSEIALFSGTAGKTFKRATTTGLLKGTSGVLSAASAGTDYVAPFSASSVRLENKNGYGSSSTKIPRYTNNTQVGTGIACTDSSTLGTVCTVATAGTYCGGTGGRSDAGAIEVGFSLNSDHLTSGIDSGSLTNVGEILAQGGSNGAFQGAGAHFCKTLAVNDVVRPHHSGTLGTNTDKADWVYIERIR